jgi:ABC transport system ATP-binding/permease protein
MSGLKTSQVLANSFAETAIRGESRCYGQEVRHVRITLPSDWVDSFASVAADPDAAHREFATRCRAEAPPAKLSRPRPTSSLRPAPCRLLHQVFTVTRRQLPLLLADRGHFLFLAVLPFTLGTLALLVPGDVGLGAANPRGDAAHEPVQIVFLLSISAIFMGTALTIRDLVGERNIFRREQAVGLSATAYLLAKIVVYCVIAAAQTAILTAIVVVGKVHPPAARSCWAIRSWSCI